MNNCGSFLCPFLDFQPKVTLSSFANPLSDHELGVFTNIYALSLSPLQTVLFQSPMKLHFIVNNNMYSPTIQYLCGIVKTKERSL